MIKKILTIAVALLVGGYSAQAEKERDVLILEIAGETSGTVKIELFNDIAPLHVERIKELTQTGAYNNIAFHRVIDGFMAQTGDVQYGDVSGDNLDRAGMGGSDLPDLKAEFSALPFRRGTVGMARSQNPDSGNSQFFIMFEDGSFLNGQYTVFGRVISGQEVVDSIKLGDGQNGSVTNPDYIKTATIE